MISWKLAWTIAVGVALSVLIVPIVVIGAGAVMAIIQGAFYAIVYAVKSPMVHRIAKGALLTIAVLMVAAFLLDTVPELVGFIAVFAGIPAFGFVAAWYLIPSTRPSLPPKLQENPLLFGKCQLCSGYYNFPESEIGKYHDCPHCRGRICLFKHRAGGA